MSSNGNTDRSSRRNNHRGSNGSTRRSSSRDNHRSSNSFWRDPGRENSPTSRNFTSPNDIVDVRISIFSNFVFDGQQVLLDAMVIDVSPIILRNNLIRGIWYLPRKGDDQGIKLWNKCNPDRSFGGDPGRIVGNGNY